MSSNLALLVIGEFALLAVVAAGFCGIWARRLSQQNRELKRKIDSQARAVVSSFIARELDDLGKAHSLRHAPDEKFLKLIRLRIRWLEIEQKALVEQGAAKSDNALLLRYAAPLLDAFSDAPPPKKSWGARRAARSKGGVSGVNGQESSRELERAKAVIAEQKQIIQQLRGEQSNWQHQDGMGAAGVGLAEVVAEVEQNTTAQAASLGKLEEELARANDTQRAINDELLQRHLQSGSSDTPSAADDRSRMTAQATELLQRMETAHLESLTELKRMRSVNSRQRMLILDLEKQLAQDLPAGMAEVSSALVERLKLQVRDYDTCTATLEMETEDLRDRIAALNEIIAQTPSTGSPHILEQLCDVYIPNQAASDSSERLDFLKLLHDLQGAPGPDAAMETITQWCRPLEEGLAVMTMIRGEAYWATNLDNLDNHLRQLIRGIAPDAGARHLDLAQGSIFIFDHCRLFIAADTHGELSGLDTQALVKLFELIDRHLAPAARPAPEAYAAQHLARLRTEIKRIDQNQNYLIEEAARISFDLQREMKGYLDKVELKERQRDGLAAILEEFDTGISMTTKGFRSVYNRLLMAAADAELETTAQPNGPK